MNEPIVESLPFAVAVLNLNSCQVVSVNSRFSALFENQRENHILPSMRDLNALLGDELIKLIRKQKGVFKKEIKVDRKRYSYEFHLNAFSDDMSFGTLVGVDKSEIIKAESKLNSYVRIIEESNKELYPLAHTDPLTETANRRALFADYEARSKASTQFHCFVSILDIDHFKGYNDKYGHDFGDFVLKEFAVQIRNQIPPKSIFSRIGGEEFCVVDFEKTNMNSRKNLEQALSKVQGLQLQTPITESVNISFSAGIAEYGVDGETLDQLLKNADRALYYAKANGRSCVIPYSADLFEMRDTTLIAKVDSD